MILKDLWRDCALRRSRMIRGLSARELATLRDDGEPRRVRMLCAEFSDEEWRLVAERHLSDSCMLTTRHWAECRVRVMSPVFANVHDASGLPPTPEKIAATQRTNVEGQRLSSRTR